MGSRNGTHGIWRHKNINKQIILTALSEAHKINFMKKSIFIAIVLLLSLAVSAQDKKKIVEITFKTSITCDNCVNTIMSSLPLEKGIKDVKCDLGTREVKVSFRNDKTDKDKIKRSLEKLGYLAEEVKKNDKRKKE